MLYIKHEDTESEQQKFKESKKRKGHISLQNTVYLHCFVKIKTSPTFTAVLFFSCREGNVTTDRVVILKQK